MNEILEVTAALTATPRRGWVQRGIPNPETVATHMYRMAMQCWAYPWGTEADRARAIQMAILHDAAEAITGDITPADGISREDKRRREGLAMEFITCLAMEVGLPELAKDFQDIWQEYDQHKSLVSRIVHQIDKLDAVHQALYYSRQYPNLIPNPQYPTLRLRDFRADGYIAQITDPWLVRIRDDVLCAWDAYESRKSELHFILVVGAPGVGKGTQCTEAAARAGFAHISVGDLLRQEQANPTSHFRHFIGHSFAARVPVPPQLAMKLLIRELDNVRAQSKPVILLDGFPRSIAQLEEFEQQITNDYSTIIMESTRETQLQRLAIRGETSKRQDDDPAKLEERVDMFAKSDAPVWERLSGRKSTYKIDCNGVVTEVAALFTQCIAEILAVRDPEAQADSDRGALSL